MMFFRSIKFQLAMLGFLSFIFMGIVVFQMHYTQKLQMEQIKRLEKSHKIIKNYLSIYDTEQKIITEIRNSYSNASDSKKIKKIKTEIGDWEKNFNQWCKNVAEWEKENYFMSEFSSKFKQIKARQFKTYRKAHQLALDKRTSDSEHLLKVESHFQPLVHDTINKILEGISQQMKNDQERAEKFFYYMIIAVSLAFAALAFTAFSIFRNLNVNFKRLRKGADKISEGDFDSPIKINAPAELISLAESFNNMQTAIKSRDEEIQKDKNEIQKLNDILERKVEERNKTILQQNTALKRKNQELEQILYAASHDLRTPLISIQGFSEELKTACNSLSDEIDKNETLNPEAINEIMSDEITVALNYIINGSTRMEVLLEGLLRLSRMGRESLQIQKVNMSELLQNVSDALSFQLNEAEGSLEISELDDCNGDPSQLEQVFFNLISNAIKYRHPERKPEIKVYSEKGEGFTHYFVADNGQGISEEHLGRVFHAFFRVDGDEKTQGDGVGLAIVNRALDLHNGRAWVESKLGESSVFSIEIPDNINSLTGNDT